MGVQHCKNIAAPYMATPAACAAETARARSQPLRQLQEAYHIVIGTRFGGWLFEHSEALVFAPPDTIIKEGFAPYSSAMKRARDILIGIEISDLFKQAIADAAWTSYRAVFADMKVRKALMDWPKNQPSWEDVKSLAEHAEAAIAETYVLAGHKTHARPIVPQKDPARNGTVTLASTSGDAIFINMHPDAWLLTSTPRTPTSIIGDMFHEHHHCLQRDLIKAHRSGAISRDHPMKADLELLSTAAWIDTLSRKLSDDWYKAMICEKDAHYLSGIFHHYARHDGGDGAIREKARITWQDKVLQIWRKCCLASAKPTML